MVVEKIGQAAMYEMLAEECSELAQMALKAARLLRGENPCGMSPKEVDAGLTEEFTDVMLCAQELDLENDREIRSFKLKRFLERWDNAHRFDQDM